MTENTRQDLFLYHHLASSASRKVRFCLAEKGLSYGERQIDFVASSRCPSRVRLRHSPGTPATSEAGGEAEAIGWKADVGLECRLLGVERTLLVRSCQDRS